MMTTYHFDPSDSFGTVRQRVDEINAPANRVNLARVSWLEGTAKGESITFLYDEMAERFGHTIDKSALHHEILTSLYNGIPLDVELVPRPQRGAADDAGSSAHA